MNLAPYIDHTLLRPDATEDDIRRLCQEAAEFGFHSVCVHGAWVREAVAILKGTPVVVAAVTGFPLGAMESEAKAYETRIAARDGAGEIDTVMNIGWLRQGADDRVQHDLRGVVGAAEGRGVKVILETVLLTDEEKRRACRLSLEAGAAFVKTSTGFGPGGATIDDVKLLREAVSGKCGVKASGGIRDRASALAMIKAGATRLGTSASVAIVREQAC